MAIGRRGFIQSVLGVATLGKRAGLEISKELGQASFISKGIAVPSAENWGANYTAPITGGPVMKHEEAVKLIFGQSWVRDGYEEEIREYAKSCFVEYFDPDIANKKSWSHSYKCLVQRERFIARELNKRLTISTDMESRIREKINEYMFPTSNYI